MPADLHDRARVGEALERERLDPCGLVRRAGGCGCTRPTVTQLLPRNPLFEQSVESFARLKQLLLELASRRSLGLLPLDLVVQVLVVVDKRVQLLVERKCCRLG